MDAQTQSRTSVLLELLREAGEERVSLDELAVAGAEDPARTLFELELQGFTLERVYETAASGRVECVRLAAPEPLPVAGTVTASAPPAAPRGTRAPLLAGALGALLLALGVARRRA